MVALLRRVTSRALPGRYPRLVLIVMASVLLLSGCMLSPLFQAPAAVMTGIAVLLGLAACGGGGGGGGGGGDTTDTAHFPAIADLRVLYQSSGLGVVFAGSNNEDLGFSLSAGRDVNADTNNDLVIGAPYAFSGKGQAYVVFGGGHMTTLGNTLADRSMSDLTTAQHGIVLATYSGSTGTAVLLAPSLSGDGVADIVVGSPYYAGSSTGQGRVSVVFGSSSLTPSSTAEVVLQIGETSLNGTNGFSIRAGMETNRLGMSLAAGDLTGDGGADLLMGAPYYTTSTFRPHVTLVKGSIYSGTDGFIYDNAYSGEGGTATGKWMFGSSSATAQTGVGQSIAISGDGFAVVGMPAYGATFHYGGRVAVLNGHEGGINTYFPSTLGSLVAGEGLVITGFEERYTRTGGVNDYTQIYDYAYQVGQVVTAGDLDGQGKDDVVMATNFFRATYHYSSSTSGYDVSTSSSSYRVFVMFGENTIGGSHTSLALYSAVPSEMVPASTLAEIGLPPNYAVTALHAGMDVNGDGVNDLIIGVQAPDTDRYQPTQVIAFVVFGGTELHGKTIDVSTMSTTQGFTVTAPRLSGAEGYYTYTHVSVTSGDVNGDLRPDAIIGVTRYEGPTDGRVYVIFGLAPGKTFPSPIVTASAPKP